MALYVIVGCTFYLSECFFIGFFRAKTIYLKKDILCPLAFILRVHNVLSTLIGLEEAVALWAGLTGRVTSQAAG